VKRLRKIARQMSRAKNMKSFRTNAATSRSSFLIFVLVCLLTIPSATIAAEFSSARVTQVIKDVRLLSQQAAARSAAVNDEVNNGTAVRTGTDSRTELTFPDLTIARLGANTIFSFDQQARQLDLRDGAVLVAVPKNASAVKINTAAVTAAITGGTALFEFHPKIPARLLILEGSGEFCSKLYPSECVTVPAGEMAMMSADGHLTQPTKFNAALVYKTSKLVTSFPTLPNADLIMEVIDQQQQEFGGPSSSSASPDKHDPIDVTSTSVAVTGASTSGGSSKFGPPSAITQPNPYVITSGTQINTDPTITTNGITNFGKIYRGASIDGPLPTWLGTSVSAFDNVDFFDSNGGGFVNPSANSLPIPGFLFASLQLAGDPTVSNTNGYPILGLVSQSDITTSAAGTVFTFGGIQQVGLIALNGSITLSGVGFANFGELFVYARGSASDITFDSPVSNLNRVQLRAERFIEVGAPVTVNGTVSDHRGFKALAGHGITINSNITSTGGGITLQSLGGITVSSTAQLQTLLDSMGNSSNIIIIADNDTTLSVSGTVQANQGEVDIRNNGATGITTLDNATIHGDIVKISALGTNGVLNIGTGNLLNADTILKLYAPGSNGTLNFLSNVTLSSPTNILAANTINISQGVTVTINSPVAADVYTNHPNYFGFGGTGTPVTSGTFGGAGAKNPLPLAQAPALGGPNQGP
jgi:hypothetical protein